MTLLLEKHVERSQDLIARYVQKAMERARFEQWPEEGIVYGEIPQLPDVWATAETEEECRRALEDVLKEWIKGSVGGTWSVD
ncbi:type II toxin-antitoxin system HicB family antitoxin [Thermomicrobiaceae bacterium CFH 74404]|uniref:Type II toxin-antitoxin system HicB family antitoxin n=1 Tax=Thermalbibacter longus TaxID=2951981 RepID=A0AA41WE93_9BACT|nr:type II toxin-antitoxin system HicB family antitoxin [Thermalbibacter longus]MCM8749498.1 type II toxin-antitoxin system HicB family antitoxin [Thermalbibacter longus]